MPVPIALSSVPTTQTEQLPDTGVIDELLPVLAADSLPRLIVLGSDASLAAVLTHLMRTERLHVEVGFVPVETTYASRVYQTATGNAAAKIALEGRAIETPLIRDDTGTALVGRASITGPEGAKLEGEAYVDDTLLFSGIVNTMLISPTMTMPGVRARVRKGLRKRTWVSGRAAQLGTPGAIVTRDGITNERKVPRSTFYRFEQPWLLVR
ncbi:hypothetical protein NN3_37370 [Nocardia neocaledoniensis NBRC 108232]|uniref:Peptidase M50 n=1 Tax=Nocardia neocaledoniensis TaxID=236511 RepID=A0A317NLW9_9NOCA|nr:hypothetical protein [Nocardia neocaledoniensis]PWV75912.1 hypothetical protein DFR69_10413 [Nocardia neocaledoniensis]GEM32730.1 hypothetical protein NN3_37370 [Nocardia neocaledoniensis NBRC 108232]